MVNMMPAGKCPMEEGRLLLNRKRVVDIIEGMKDTSWFSKSPKQDFSGKSYNIFVGRFNYPNVNVGLLFSEQQDPLLDAPRQWSAQNMGIPKIALLRSSLASGGAQAHVKIASLHSALIEKLKYASEEVSLSSRPLDVEIKVDKPLQFKMTFAAEATPFGPRAQLQNVSVTENASVPRPIERIHSDTDLKASAAVDELSAKGFDEQYLTRLLSAGQLGTLPQRKLVPTRWAITATDDMIGKRHIAELYGYESLPIGFYAGGYLGNYYYVITLPGPFRYELFETHVPTGNCGTDFEDSFGRKSYASNTAGGYYAARLSIVEELHKIKRTASLLVLRFVTEDYYMPLGVWVVREAVRSAMHSLFTEVPGGSREALLNAIRDDVLHKFRLDVTSIYRFSKLLEILRNQRTLADFR